MSFQELLALILSDNDNLSFSEAAVRRDLVWRGQQTWSVAGVPGHRM